MIFLISLVSFAIFVEAVAGFGSIILTVSIAAHVIPIRELLPIFVPINWALCVYMVWRHRAAIAWRPLLRRILPLMAAGLPLGLLVFQRKSDRPYQLWFSLFVVALAVTELVRRLRLTPTDEAEGSAAPAGAPLPSSLGAALLVLGGVVHGMFATGGPLVVYVVGREIGDKRVFRSTLSALWLVLNTGLVATYGLSGALSRETTMKSALLLPSLGIGLAAGEWAHARIAERPFRLLIFTLLLVAGLILAVRSA